MSAVGAGGAPRRFTLRPEERIRRDRDVEKILREGRRLSGGMLSLAWRFRAEDPGGAQSRFAIRIPRRFGNAVSRNRAKRLLREIFRRDKHHLAPGTDLLLTVQPRRAGGSPGYGEWEREFKEHCRQAKIWQEE